MSKLCVTIKTRVAGVDCVIPELESFCAIHRLNVLGQAPDGSPSFRIPRHDRLPRARFPLDPWVLWLSFLAYRDFQSVELSFSHIKLSEFASPSPRTFRGGSRETPAASSEDVGPPVENAWGRIQGALAGTTSAWVRDHP